MKSGIITVSGIILALSNVAAFAAEPAKKPVVVTVTKAPSKPVSAPPMVRCYSPQEYRAEQAVRYHTQLMVSGMLCQNQVGPQIYSQYQGFTLRNQSVITRAENRLIDYYKNQKKAAPERELHSLRTNLANDFSMRAMQQSITRFCQTAAPRVKLAAVMQPRQFENYLTMLDLRQTSTVPLCPQSATLQSIKATVPAAKSVAKAPVTAAKTVKPVEKTVKTVPSQPQK